MYPNTSPKRFYGKTLQSLLMALASSAVVMGCASAASAAAASNQLGLVVAEQASFDEEIVRYHDLDLTKVADADRLNMRIRRAAKRVCEEHGISKQLLERKIKQCAKQAYGTAWADATGVISQHQIAVRISK